MHVGAKAPIFKFAAQLRANMTEPEKRLWEYLRTKPQGFKFRRQHPFGNYILDFYCHKAKLSIEVDGKSHDSAEQKEHDNIRTSFIREMRVREMRFTNDEVNNELDDVIERIELALRNGSF